MDRFFVLEEQMFLDRRIRSTRGEYMVTAAGENYKPIYRSEESQYECTKAAFFPTAGNV